MNHFITLSLSSHYDKSRRWALRERAFTSLAAGVPHEVDVFEDDSQLTVLRGTPAANIAEYRGDGRFMLRLGGSVTDIRQGRQLSSAELANTWFNDGARSLEALAAPFALCGRQCPGGPFTAVADRYGLVHLYGWQGDGVSAIASSALIIGQVFRLGLDLDAVGQFALMGHYAGTATSVLGVRKCAPGHALEMSAGRLTTRRVFARHTEAITEPEKCLDAGVEALRESVQMHVDAYPGCDIELSGGIDSRLLLSAIPGPLRRRHRAVTLGPPTSADVRIARLIAESNGMQHRVVDTSVVGQLEPTELLRHLRAASRRHDHAINPIDKLAIEVVRPEIGENPRLSGQNGELTRGFYYPGQHLNGGYEPDRVERLLKWRLIGNDAVRDDLFNREYSEKARRGLRNEVTSLVRPWERWPQALDHLYLDQRMHRWCGNAVSAAYAQRAILMPFFHPVFVDWALASAPQSKQGSRLACQLISTLAPELASLPLDAGHTPVQLAYPGPGQATRNAITLGRKLVRRIRHRASGARRHNLGTRSATETLASCDMDSVLDWDTLRATGIFDLGTVDAIADGRLSADRATLGFLFALEYTITSLNQSAARPRESFAEPVTSSNNVAHQSVSSKFAA